MTTTTTTITWDYKAKSAKETGYEDLIPQLADLTSPEEFNKMTEDKKNEIVDKAIEIIRSRNHFPIYYFNENGIKQEIKKVINKNDVHFNEEGQLITQSSLGTLLLDFLFPNLHDAEAGNATDNCMFRRFYDDVKLAKCLKRYYANYKFSNIRTMFFMYGRFFWNTPTNFAPIRAKAIYEKFCPANGVIYDYSCGFGGRMLGALSSNKNFTYIGCEPNTETYAHLNELGQYIALVKPTAATKYKIYNECSEDHLLSPNSVDFAFSCPPFYGLERYSDEPTQSINRYPQYKDWLEGYVRPTIQNCIAALKPDGLYGVDIFDFSWQNRPYHIVNDWKKIAKEEGLELVGEYPIISRARKVKTSETNVEKIYIFKKK